MTQVIEKRNIIFQQYDLDFNTKIKIMKKSHAQHPYFEVEEAASRLEDSCIDNSFLSRRGSGGEYEDLKMSQLQ